MANKSIDGLETLEIDHDRKRDLLRFEKSCGIRFKRLGLLNLAFSHRSFANESIQIHVNNERLEFLGDSVLGLIIAECLVLKYPDKSEGELAKAKSVIVSEETLSEIALALGISSVLLLGRGEELSGGRNKKAILADSFEALLGAYYVDQGLRAVNEFVLRLFSPVIDDVILLRRQSDFKTSLQELSQKLFKTNPKYTLTDKAGPDHERVFTVEVQVGVRHFGPAQGASKKAAEQKAAEMAMAVLSTES